jgi:1-acyl-sn-glycerol-3-phosphate acyltransferase/DNA-directed RNA polymerase subunit RPC12/RpoP
MILKRRYHPTNFKFFTWLLRHTYGLWLRWTYRITAINVELFKTVKPPFVMVGNHTTLLDPFIANAFVPFPVHWVASDGNMRNPIMRFLLLKLVGCIPKSKAIPDIETVSWIVDIIRRKHGVVGMYPEGQSSWTGTPFPAFFSSAKLLRLLRVPVVLAKTHGGYLTKPRWSHVRRPGKVEVAFSVLFTPEQLHRASLSEIDGALNDALAYDDTAWCRERGIQYKSARGAESLELALYICPRCAGKATMHSAGNAFSCDRCGFSVEYRPDGAFSLRSAGKGHGYVPPFDEAPFFDSIVTWNNFQNRYLSKLLAEWNEAENTAGPIFSDELVTLKRGRRIDSMKTMLKGRIELYADRLEFHDCRNAARSPVVFSLEHVEAEGVLKWNFFEFYQGMNVYRVVFKNPKASGRKYADAIGLLRGIAAGHLPGR